VIIMDAGSVGGVAAALSYWQFFGEEFTMAERDRLSGVRVAILATDMFEEVEMTAPREALEEGGAETVLIAPSSGALMSARHYDKGGRYEVEQTLDEAEVDDYDALLLPGGALNADALRVVPKAQEFVRAFDAAGKPMAVICHAPWLLVSAGLVAGRVLTSYHTIADDIRNAGGMWLDNEVVEEENWVTSRQPADIPAFNDAMLRLFETCVAEVEEDNFAFRERLAENEEE
jgi:protease I